MELKALVIACTLVGSGLFVVVGQQRPSLGFTAEQAQAGKVAYEKTCVRCHTTTLMGRAGKPGEVPALESLSESDQGFIKKYGPVPALAGPAFLARWKDKTVTETIARIAEGVGAFPPEGRNDQTAFEITAYSMQVSGAKPGSQPLTKSALGTVGALMQERQ